MAVLDTGYETLSGLQKKLDPDGNIADIVEILEKTDDIVGQAAMMECNDGSSHEATIRTGIPEPTFRRFNEGVAPTKSTTAQVTFKTGMMEAYSWVDVKLANKNGNAQAYRLGEDMAHIQGMTNTAVATLFYGNEKTELQKFTGLSGFYNDLSVDSADNIVDAGGTGADNTSIWLVTFGPKASNIIYPKGSMAGLQHQDLGEQTREMPVGSGKSLQMYGSHHSWDLGLAVEDWTKNVRICNIDVSDLTTEAGQKALINHLIDATERVDTMGAQRSFFYANRTVRTALRHGIQAKIANNLTWETVEGKRVAVFDDIQFGRCDSLLNTEARVQ